MPFKPDGPNNILFDNQGRVIRLPMKRQHLCRTSHWSAAEHNLFLDALQEYPQGPWQKIAAMVGKTSPQVQSHCQKYRGRVLEYLQTSRSSNKASTSSPSAPEEIAVDTCIDPTDIFHPADLSTPTLINATDCFLESITIDCFSADIADESSMQDEA